MYKVNRKLKIVQEEDTSIKSGRSWLTILKWALYVFLAFVMHAVTMTPELFSIGGIKPLLLIPLVVSVAMFEGEMNAAFFALFAGFVWTSGPMVGLFWGFHSFVLFLCAVLTAVCMKYYFKITVISAFIFTAVTTVIYLGVSFYVNYGMWSFPGIGTVFKEVYVPSFFYTVVFTPILYFVVKFMYVFVWQRINDRKWSN